MISGVIIVGKVQRSFSLKQGVIHTLYHTLGDVGDWRSVTEYHGNRARNITGVGWGDLEIGQISATYVDDTPPTPP